MSGKWKKAKWIILIVAAVVIALVVHNEKVRREEADRAAREAFAKAGEGGVDYRVALDEITKEINGISDQATESTRKLIEITEKYTQAVIDRDHEAIERYGKEMEQCRREFEEELEKKKKGK